MATSKYQIAFVERRKEKKLCLKCGNPLDREGTYCIECRKKLQMKLMKQDTFCKISEYARGAKKRNFSGMKNNARNVVLKRIN